MNKSIKILDCTLRDGGFVNNWKFGNNCILDILKNLSLSKVDIIEIGYLRDSAKKSIHTTEFSDFSEINEVVSSLNITQNLVAIIDYGMFSIDSVVDSVETSIDGLRVTFKKHEDDDALYFCKKLIEKGYKVFVQPVCITSYNDLEISRLVEKVNKINPFSMAIVDTYGFMFEDDVLRYFKVIDESLNDDILIGYHGHNNYQLASSNSISIIKNSHKRGVIVDSSMYGMGKGAGNAHTEIVANYCNIFQNTDYDIEVMLEIIDSYIIPIKSQNKWGYDLNYFLNALLRVHPNYVQFLIEKKELLMSDTIKILKNINSSKSVSYVESKISSLYNDYYEKNICVGVNDILPTGKNELFLIIGPGKSLIKKETLIKKILKDKKCNVIAINFIPKEVNIDYLLISNNKRFDQLKDRVKLNKSFSVIFTSNVISSPSEVTSDFTIELDNIEPDKNYIFQNSLISMLEFLKKTNPSLVYLAGFDGFNDNMENYYTPGMELKSTYGNINNIVSNKIKNISKSFDIEFITPSLYNDRS
jgi:4-hydroxy 2-oxovalerate aldolase